MRRVRRSTGPTVVVATWMIPSATANSGAVSSSSGVYSPTSRRMAPVWATREVSEKIVSRSRLAVREVVQGLRRVDDDERGRVVERALDDLVEHRLEAAVVVPGPLRELREVEEETRRPSAERSKNETGSRCRMSLACDSDSVV
jgi:hypothetical protein